MPDPFKIDAHVHVFTSDMPLIDNPRHAPKYSFTHANLPGKPTSNCNEDRGFAIAGDKR
jgi:hypothetical protein